MVLLCGKCTVKVGNRIFNVEYIQEKTFFDYPSSTHLKILRCKVKYLINVNFNLSFLTLSLMRSAKLPNAYQRTIPLC